MTTTDTRCLTCGEVIEPNPPSPKLNWRHKMYHTLKDTPGWEPHDAVPAPSTTDAVEAARHWLVEALDRSDGEELVDAFERLIEQRTAQRYRDLVAAARATHQSHMDFLSGDGRESVHHAASRALGAALAALASPTAQGGG